MISSERPIIWSATPTPFLADGSLDQKSLEKVVEQHVRLQLGGVFLAGTCGEGPFMPNEQRADLVRSFKRLAAGRLHVAVQVSDTSPARVTVLGASAGTSRVEIAIREGRKRQVRRMFGAIRHPVLSLLRERVGPVALGNQPSGTLRELEPRELAALREAAGL